MSRFSSHAWPTFVALALTFLTGCSSGPVTQGSASPTVDVPVQAPAARAGKARGTLQSLTLKSAYSREDLQAVLIGGGISMPIEVQRRIGTGSTESVTVQGASAANGASQYVVEYWSVAPDGSPVLLSGLLAVPAHPAETVPLLAYLHGTKNGRGDAPSQHVDGPEPALMTALYGANGWAVAMPDYYGLGICTSGLQTYFLDSLSTPACTDMVAASQAALTQLGLTSSGELFITGYSQGAHLTMALAHELQVTRQLAVTAAAPMAGAYRTTASDFAGFVHAEDVSNGLTTVLALWAYAFHTYYHAPANLPDIFQDDWVGVMPGLLSDNVSSEALAERIWTGTVPPRYPTRVLKPGCFDAAAADPGNPFARALVLNEQWNWVPTFPMAITWSATDDMLPPSDSSATYQHMADKGAAVEAIIATGSHMDAASPLMLSVFRYFEARRAR